MTKRRIRGDLTFTPSPESSGNDTEASKKEYDAKLSAPDEEIEIQLRLERERQLTRIDQDSLQILATHYTLESLTEGYRLMGEVFSETADAFRPLLEGLDGFRRDAAKAELERKMRNPAYRFWVEIKSALALLNPFRRSL